VNAAAERIVTEDPAGAAAERLAAAARRGAQLALAGGSTPRAAYERVAAMDVDWDDVTLWFGDERCVAPDHEHSNYAMVRDALLERIDGLRPRIMRLEGEMGALDAAVEYERELRAAFGEEGVPRLDLVLLGLGPDAHTASLFPNDPALGEREHLAVGVHTPGMAPLVPRVTLTLPVLNAAASVVFLVAGEQKADAVRRAFDDAPDPSAPASLVRPASGGLELILDPAAAAALD
jgi:6-phosphogluconolactonase